MDPHSSRFWASHNELFPVAYCDICLVVFVVTLCVTCKMITPESKRAWNLLGSGNRREFYFSRWRNVLTKLCQFTWSLQAEKTGTIMNKTYSEVLIKDNVLTPMGYDISCRKSVVRINVSFRSISSPTNKVSLVLFTILGTYSMLEGLSEDHLSAQALHWIACASFVLNTCKWFWWFHLGDNLPFCIHFYMRSYFLSLSRNLLSESRMKKTCAFSTILF